jgi:serine/threonine protein kinase
MIQTGMDIRNEHPDLPPELVSMPVHRTIENRMMGTFYLLGPRNDLGEKLERTWFDNGMEIKIWRVNLAHRMIEAIAPILFELSKRGITHGDTKPSNMSIPRNRARKGGLWDIDLMNTFDRRNRPKNPKYTHGTIRYMPLEIAAAKNPTPTSDLASLSYSVLECMGRKLSHAAGIKLHGELYEILENHAGEDPDIKAMEAYLRKEYPEDIYGEISRKAYGIIEFLKRGLQRRWEDRPQTLGEVQMLINARANLSTYAGTTIIKP